MPSLLEQIRGHRAVQEIPVTIRRPDGQFVERVDPITRQCTGESQQFLKAEGGTLAILPKYQWVIEPAVIDVDYFKIG